MERLVFGVVIATTLVAYAAGVSSDAAVYGGLFWGAVAWSVVWARRRLRGQRG